MSSRWISTALRSAVRQRAQGCCEYCRVHEDDVLVPHEPDHVIAEQHGGRTVLENLALSCFHCNRLKGPNVASIDPETNLIAPLFHPRENRWPDHFQTKGPEIISMTPTARVTIFLLKLNAPGRLRVREGLIRAARFPL